MGSLFFSRRFPGFGPSAFDPAPATPPVHQVSARRRSMLRQRLRLVCPRRPGVYGMLDPAGDLIYVGKAKNLRARLLSYFRSHDPKAGRILGQTQAIVWEHAPSEFAALLRELELIRRWRPRFNVHGQPHRRRRTFVCLGRRPAPYAFLARRPPGGGIASFGPILGGWKAREAVRRLNDWFQLRDCPQAQEMVFADQTELFPVLRAAGCIRHEIGTCLGPCAGACTSAAYRDRVRAARAFLAGSDASAVEQLAQDMAAASAALAFERAAALRDKLDPLRWLQNQLDRLRQARETHSFVYAVPGFQGRNLWYLIRQGRVEAVVAAPVRPADRRRAAAALEAVYLGRRRVGGRGHAAEVEVVLLVASWFRRHRGERARTMTPREALARLGGSPASASPKLKVLEQQVGRDVRHENRGACSQ